MNRLRREMVELCEALLCVRPDPQTSPVAAMAFGKLAGKARLMLPLLQPKVSKAVKANRVRRETKRAGEKRGMAELRRQVFERANDKGELCGNPFFLYGGGSLCHLDGGIGRRRQKQSPSNCVAEHEVCHKSIDREPLKWLPQIQAWAARHGYPLPERFRKLAALRGVDISQPET